MEMPVPLHQLQRELRISISYLKDSVVHLKSGEKNPSLYSYKLWSIKIRLTLLTSVHPATAPSHSGFPTQNWVLPRGNYCWRKIQWAKWIFRFSLSLFFFYFLGKGADNIISKFFFTSVVTAKSRPLIFARKTMHICLWVYT